MPLRRLAPILAGAVVLAVGSLSAPAAAQRVATRELPVSGNTPQICLINRSTLQTGGLVNIRGTEGDTLQIVELVDPSTLAARPARATLELAAVCNFPHRLRIESQNNGLWPIEGNIAPTRNDFATALPYQAVLNWADRNGTLLADAEIRRSVEERMDIDAPAAGTIRLDIAVDAGASNTRAFSPVLAGTYADTVRIFLEPR